MYALMITLILFFWAVSVQVGGLSLHDLLSLPVSGRPIVQNGASLSKIRRK